MSTSTKDQTQVRASPDSAPSHGGSQKATL